MQRQATCDLAEATEDALHIFDAGGAQLGQGARRTRGVQLLDLVFECLARRFEVREQGRLPAQGFARYQCAHYLHRISGH